MAELKPCPFCGGEAHLIEYSVIGFPVEYGVKCEKCSAMTYPKWITAMQAVEAWNRRVNDAAD